MSTHDDPTPDRSKSTPHADAPKTPDTKPIYQHSFDDILEASGTAGFTAAGIFLGSNYNRLSREVLIPEAIVIFLAVSAAAYLSLTRSATRG